MAKLYVIWKQVPPFKQIPGAQTLRANGLTVVAGAAVAVTGLTGGKVKTGGSVAVTGTTVAVTGTTVTGATPV